MTVYRTPHEKRPILNLAYGFILAIALAIIAILLGLPAILSTSWGQEKILHYANQKIPGKIAAAAMHFSWLGPQTFESFALKDSQGNPVLHGEKAVLQVPFWKLALRKIDNGALHNLDAHLLISGSGESNLQTALGLIPAMGTPLTTVKLQGVNAAFEEGKNFTAAGKTQVNKTPGEFALTFHDNVWTGHVNNFPVDLLQQAAGIQDLKSFLGETLNLEIEQRLAPEGRLIEGKVESKLLQATVQGNFDPTNPEKGEGNIQLIQLKLDSMPNLEIKDVLIPWKLEGDTLQFGLQGMLGNGRLQGGGSLSRTAVQGNFNLLAIPTPLIEKLAGTDGLTDLLGPSMDLKGEINSLEKVDLIVRGDQWSGKAILIKDDGWKLKEPAVASLSITPKRFAVIRNWIKKGAGEKFTLQAPAQLQIKISEIGIPSGAHWTEGYLDGSIALDQLTLLDAKTQQVIHLNDIQGDVTSRNLGKALQFNLQGKQLGEEGQEGELLFKGTLKEGWLKNGHFNKERFAIHGSAKVNNVAAGMICEIICLEELTRAKMEAVFGPFVNGSLQAELRAMEGPFQMAVAGSKGSIQLDGMLNKNHLTLRSPFQLQLTPSPELGESVLKDLLPILNGMVRGDQKIQLTINPAGFYLPLRGATLETIQIDLLTLSLGRLEFQKDGQMGKIVSLISSTSDNIIPVWFTPIYVSAQKGVIQVQRFDMLALDRFPLALWGTVDLPNDRINMVVGLSGRALQSAFRVKVPDPDYMMQFPLRGSIGDAGIDKSRAATRIAALTAQAAGGPQGLVLGTVLGIASGVFSDPKPPAPTTDPLPWADSLGDESSEDSGVQQGTNPIKGLEKGLEKGLKKFLNR